MYWANDDAISHLGIYLSSLFLIKNGENVDCRIDLVDHLAAAITDTCYAQLHYAPLYDLLTQADGFSLISTTASPPSPMDSRCFLFTATILLIAFAGV